MSVSCRPIVRLLPLVVLSACATPAPPSSIEVARQQYLAAKAVCDRDYPRSLAAQADCRARAANAFIRPYYRYGDLMSYAQGERKALAVAADEHRISRTSYERQVAASERWVSREEDRRNRQLGVSTSFQVTPLTPLVATVDRLLD